MERRPCSSSAPQKAGRTHSACTARCAITTRCITSRHADIFTAARDHQTFSSAQGLTVNYGELEMIGLADNPPMVMQDPPVHTEFRKLVARGFTPRQVEAVEPTVREFVVERIEGL